MPELVAVLYSRVSTEEQGRHGFSLPEQQRECRVRAEAVAATRGKAVVIHEFTDQASGEVLERPGLEACRAFLAQHRADLFVCLDPDRFSRSLNLQLLVADEIERRGTELVFVSHDYKKTPEGKLFFQLRGAIAEFEKAKILERTRRGRRGKLARGGIPNWIPTWGYSWDTTNKTLEPDPETAPWVRQIFAWYAGGWSYARIAEELDRLGVKPARGARWHRTTIMRMLKNATYAGRLTLNRWDCEGNGPLRSIPRARRPRPRTDRIKPPEQWVTVPVPALIAPDLWEQVQRTRQNRSRPTRRPGGPLSGLAECGLCGGRLHYMGTPAVRYLRCSNRYARATPCAWRDLKAAPIESALWQQVTRWLLDPAALADLRPCTPPPENPGERLERELERRRQEQRRIYHLVTRGLAPESAEGDLERIAGQIACLEAERQRARALVPVPAEAPTISDLQTRLERLTADQRRHLTGMLIDRVKVWPDGRVLYSFR